MGSLRPRFGLPLPRARRRGGDTRWPLLWGVLPMAAMLGAVVVPRVAHAVSGPVQVTGTTPASPSTATSILVYGTAPGFDNTVEIFDNSSCSGSPLATGTVAAFTSPGIPVTVPYGSTTTFWADGIDNGFPPSACSSSSVAFVQATPPPSAPVITASPATPGNSRSPSWSFTTDAGTTTTCALMRGSVTVFAAASCTSPQVYGLTGQPDATYTFSVTAKDTTTGLVSTAATSDYRLLTVPPPAPVITTSPPTPGNSRSPSWSFTTVARTTTTCSLLSGATSVVAAAACTSPRVYDLIGKPDATYTFSVTATDAAGNVSTAATAAYRLLTVPPPAPVITGSPASPGNSRSPAWSFTAAPGTTATCTLLRGSVVVSAVTPCTGPQTFDLAGQPDGTYTFSVTVTDAAGNVSASATSEYDLATPPSPPPPSAAPSPSPTPGAVTPTPTPKAVTPTPTPAPMPQPAPARMRSTTTRPTPSPTPSPSPAPATLRTRPPPPPSPPSSSTPPRAPAAPAAPVIVSGGLLADGTLQWQFSTPTGTTARCELSRDGVVIVPLGPCGDPAWYDLSGRPAGLYRFVVVSSAATGALSQPAIRELRYPGAVVAPRQASAMSPAPAPATTSWIAKLGAAVVKNAAFPLLLVLLLILFLVIQDQIDRRDPKLALAPVYPTPDLPFLPPGELPPPAMPPGPGHPSAEGPHRR